MALYRVDLKKLGQASSQVKWKSFDSINERAALAYTEWVKDQLKKQPALQNEVCTAVSNAIRRIMILMKGGVQGYVDFVVDQMKKINTLSPANVPIFPIMNEEIKSDAWLTGLVAQKFNFNDQNCGFALDGKSAGVVAKVKSPLVKDFYKVVLIDDASYSGTQAHALMWNAGLSDIFDMEKLRGTALVLAGISNTSKKNLANTNVPIHAQCDPMPSGPFGSDGVLKAMRSLPLDTINATVKTGSYSSHYEVNPATLKLEPTKGEFPPFLDLSYAVLPYKIPDSLSVPTHVLMAYGYKNDGRLKYEKQAGPWAGAGYGEEVEFPPELRHLFNSSGSIDYRETLRKNKSNYTTPLA